MIPQYKSALLISDLHLTPSMPLTAQRFFDFCEKDAPQVEAVFILGDLFEYWIGDDAASSSPFLREVKHAIANLSTKTKTFYMHGNRDFLVGPSFIKKTGLTLIFDPTMVDIAGQQYLLSHGDALCTADIGYQAFRRWTRKPWLQKLFLNQQAPAESLSEEDLASMEGVVHIRFALQDLQQGIDVVSFLAQSGILPSKGEARKLVQGGGISINRKKVESTDWSVGPELLLHGKYLLVQKGKKNYYLAEVS
ncbi:MAG: UDP-2,3-diacylglucosamine diphosphatase [Chitinophagia bacterium]|nr:UDP-2,3-diacylglucosamine diphosphatase [Chitinophagia bacterium]